MKLDQLVVVFILTGMACILSSWQQPGLAIAPVSQLHTGISKNMTAPVADSTAEDFSNIDSFAINAPPNISQDSSAIAAYLLKGCKNDMEKARAIFTWIAYNIRYDDNAYNSGNYGSMAAGAVLKRRHAVCEGYSNLYKALGGAMGLEVVRIDGYAKAYGYREGEKFTGTNPNHAWNAVKINGEWILLDATWGAGGAVGGRGHLVSRKIFTPYWFNVNKYEFLFLHFPEDAQWQLLPQTIAIKQYEDMPLVPQELFMLGFDAHDILDKALSKTLPKQLPQAFPTKHHIKLVDFPLNGQLAATGEASFTIISDENIEIAISNNLKEMPVFMKKSGNVYSASLPLKRGDLHIAIKEKGNNYSDILLYKVK